MPIILKKEIDNWIDKFGLPSLDAWKEIAPINRIFPINTKDFKKAAVSIIIFKNQDGLSLLLIKRSECNGPHSKQIAFPGGRIEENETEIEAALRETEEEVYLTLKNDTPFIKLSPIPVPISKFIVHPYIFFCENLDFKLDNFKENAEVSKQIVLNLSTLVKLDPIKKELKRINKEVPGFYLKEENEFIWGATGMILNELKYILKKRSIE